MFVGAVGFGGTRVCVFCLFSLFSLFLFSLYHFSLFFVLLGGLVLGLLDRGCSVTFVWEVSSWWGLGWSWYLI